MRDRRKNTIFVKAATKTKELHDANMAKIGNRSSADITPPGASNVTNDNSSETTVTVGAINVTAPDPQAAGQAVASKGEGLASKCERPMR